LPKRGCQAPRRDRFGFLFPAGGTTIGEFLDEFPPVKRKQAIAVREKAYWLGACSTALSPNP
jgi:hypothetical protein